MKVDHAANLGGGVESSRMKVMKTSLASIQPHENYEQEKREIFILWSFDNPPRLFAFFPAPGKLTTRRIEFQC
jgi:hypothetical protein